MAAALTHRGPDRWDTFIAGPCGLAHTRLSVLDLSAAGNQPMTLDGKVLSYNGEVYNYRELRAELDAHGEVFRGSSDTEVVLRALRRWGVERTMSRIRGMYAFAYLNTTTGEVILGRDRLGIKPLSYYDDGRRTLFASEVKAILAVTSLEVNIAATLFAIARGPEYSLERTLFRGVRQVPPGCFVRVSGGRAEEPVRYWSPLDEVSAEETLEMTSLSEPEAVDLLDERLRSSVRAMLASDAPLGVFVSGGVDSSLIAAMAARESSGDLTLFTSDVQGRHSEVEQARRVAAHLRLPLQVDVFRPGEFLARLAECTYHAEVPIVAHSNSVPFAGVARLASSLGIKPALTGEGSDELFLGYPLVVAERFRRAATAPLRLAEWPYRRSDRLASFVFASVRADALAFVHSLAAGSLEENEDLLRDARDRLAVLPKADRELHVRTLLMLNEHLPSLLHRNDRMGMLAGIESRFPFLDEAVVRFGVNLPLSHKLGRTARIHNVSHPFTVDKAVVRRLAARYLPPELAYRKKEGFPMSGLRDVRVAPQAFRSGFVATASDLPDRYWDRVDPDRHYDLAKLMAVEVFGRLFALRHTVEDTQSWITENAVMAA